MSCCFEGIYNRIYALVLVVLTFLMIRDIMEKKKPNTYQVVICIDNKLVYFKNYRVAGITYTNDLLFDRDINVAFTHLSNKINKTDFLQWAGLPHSWGTRMYHYQPYLPPLHLKITLTILDKKDQKITILYLFPERLNIPISPSNYRGILILQSIKSIKSSYYHILLHFK